MSTETDTRATYKKWLGSRADDPTLPHDLIRDAFCAGVEAGRQDHLREVTKMMPSDDGILEVWRDANEDAGLSAIRALAVLRFARALLSRYSGGQPAANPEHQRLREFYGVLTDRELIDAQQRHIEKLQAKLPASPSMATNRVREG